MNYSLKGRTAIITGASQGLGFAIAKAFVEADARIMICARHEKGLLQAVEQLSKSVRFKGQISSCVADVSKLHDVERLVQTTLGCFSDLHILVNNAGVYGPMGPIEDVDAQEWMKAIEINLYGSVWPCKCVVPHFKRQKYGKIIQLSGGGATNPLPHISAYAASKAAIVRFAESLAQEVRDFGVDVNAIAPGALNTRLLDEVLDAGPEKVGQDFYKRSIQQKEEGGASLERGASLAVYLASAESDGVSGRLISAIWDPWEQLAKYKDELRKGDVYTLRRIVPKDRGFSWQ